MNFQQAVKSGFQNYSNFQDRASRSEFWWWVLFTVIVGIVAAIIDTTVFGVADPKEMGPVDLVTTLALLSPNIAMNARRLHDVDKSGWWMLIMLTIIGIPVVLYWCCLKGDEATNRFGSPAEEPVRRVL